MKKEFTKQELGKTAFNIYSISGFLFTQEREGYNIYDGNIDKQNFICHCKNKKEVIDFLECFQD